MDFHRLPLKLLQNILSYLSYGELKGASLVCRRWKKASEKCIVNNGCIHITEKMVDKFDVIPNLTRSYRSIRISVMQDCKTLETAVATCIQRFPEIYELVFDSCSFHKMLCICVKYRNWMKHCVALRVSLLAPLKVSDSGKQQTHVLYFPALKHLIWKQEECYIGKSSEMLTIVAPNLETVDLDDWANRQPTISIQKCDRIKKIRYMTHGQFPDKLICQFSYVETFQISINQQCDLSFLRTMHRLRDLYIIDLWGLELDLIVRNIVCCSDLRTLEISGGHDGKSMLNLEDLFGNSYTLETLTLSFVTVSSNCKIQAEHLLKLTMDDMDFRETIIFYAPKLQQLSVDLDVLHMLELSCSSNFTELHVRLGIAIVELSIEHLIGPFIHRHGSVKVLALSGCAYELEVLEKIPSNRVVLHVEHLELRKVKVHVDFFRTVSKWTGLHRLNLIDCWIDCEDLADCDLIQLPNVQKMLLEDVTLLHTERSDFPVVVGGDTVVRAGIGQRVSRIKNIIKIH